MGMVGSPEFYSIQNVSDIHVQYSCYCCLYDLLNSKSFLLFRKSGAAEPAHRTYERPISIRSPVWNYDCYRSDHDSFRKGEKYFENATTCHFAVTIR